MDTGCSLEDLPLAMNDRNEWIERERVNGLCAIRGSICPEENVAYEFILIFTAITEIILYIFMNYLYFIILNKVNLHHFL